MSEHFCKKNVHIVDYSRLALSDCKVLNIIEGLEGQTQCKNQELELNNKNS